MVDAKEGVLSQTRRLTYTASLFGVRNVVLAVNKIDLVDYSRDIFEAICKEFSEFAAYLKFSQLVAIRLSARNGDNVVTKGKATLWYDGPALLAHL